MADKLYQTAEEAEQAAKAAALKAASWVRMHAVLTRRLADATAELEDVCNASQVCGIGSNNKRRAHSTVSCLSVQLLVAAAKCLGQANMCSGSVRLPVYVAHLHTTKNMLVMLLHLQECD